MTITINHGKNTRVVIVGGSFAGLAVGRHLKSHRIGTQGMDIILIEPKDYFDSLSDMLSEYRYAPGAVHLLAGSQAYDSLLTPLTIAASGLKHIRGRFLGLKPISRTKESTYTAMVRLLTDGLEDEQDGDITELEFDALILCNGRPYSAPIRPSTNGLNKSTNISQRINEIESFLAILKKANSMKDSGIIVVGGGLVGVELMSEIVYRIAKKRSNITNNTARLILVSRSRLLNSLPYAAGTYSHNWLSNRGVEILEDDEIISSYVSTGTTSNSSVNGMMNTISITTKSGKHIKASLVIDCTGLPSVSTSKELEISMQRDLGLESPFTSRGYVPVDQYLRCPKYPNVGIFAAGDIVEHIEPGVGFACSSEMASYGELRSFPPVRNAHLAESQAELIADNVRSFLEWKQASAASSRSKLQLKSYPKDVFGAKLNPLLACVSLGPRNGIIVFNDLVIGGALFYFLGGLVKFIIERSKISEIRGEPWGRAFWAFGHFISNLIHRAMIGGHHFLSFFSSLFPSRGKAKFA